MLVCLVTELALDFAAMLDCGNSRTIGTERDIDDFFVVLYQVPNKRNINTKQ